MRCHLLRDTGFWSLDTGVKGNPLIIQYPASSHQHLSTSIQYRFPISNGLCFFQRVGLRQIFVNPSGKTYGTQALINDFSLIASLIQKAETIHHPSGV